MVLSEMGELFKLSVILHFPPEVYLRRGMGELAPLLLRALHESKISALQFLRGGRFRVTLLDPAYQEELLSSDFMFEDSPIPVTPADRPTTSVYLRDLPIEISDESVRSALEAFGDVFSIRSAVYKDFPSIRNGMRILLMSVRQSIPSSLNVLGFVCRAWYPGQPIVCTICRKSGHLPQACPLSGLCRRCKQPGHVARECAQVRKPPRPPEPPPVLPDPSPPPSESTDPPVMPIVPDPPASIVSNPRDSSPDLFPVLLPSPVPPSASEEDEASMASEPSGGASDFFPSFKDVVALPVPRRVQSPDYKKLIHLLVSKLKPGCDESAVKKSAQVLIKSHKLNVSEDDLCRIVSSVSSC